MFVVYIVEKFLQELFLQEVFLNQNKKNYGKKIKRGLNINLNKEEINRLSFLLGKSQHLILDSSESIELRTLILKEQECSLSFDEMIKQGHIIVGMYIIQESIKRQELEDYNKTYTNNEFKFTNFRKKFFEKLETKTGWGKEQIKTIFNDTYFEMLNETIN